MQFSLVQLVGKNPVDFLQAQSTCDFKKYRNCRGAFCDHKGRVIATFYARQVGDNVLLRMPRDHIAVTVEKLKTFSQFARIQWLDVSAEYRVYFTKDKQENSICHQRGRYKLYETWLKKPPNCDTLNEVDTTLQFIKMGIAEINGERVEQFLPYSLGLQLGEGSNNAISLDKGCYRGQEIIARTHYLGKVKKQLYRIQTASEILEGTHLVHSEKNIAQIVLSCKNQALVVGKIDSKQDPICIVSSDNLVVNYEVVQC